MPVDPRRVQEIFLAAVEERDPAARSALLDRECADDRELRRRVESLLRAHDEPDDFLDRPIVGPAGRSGAVSPRPDGRCRSRAGSGFILGRTPCAAERSRVADGLHQEPEPPSLKEGPGHRIGPYKLLQKIGEGGMGVVYMAEQDEPVRRKVALKIIKPGMDSEPGHRPVRGRAAGPGPDGPSRTSPGSSTPAPPTPAAPTSSWSWSRASRSPSTATSDQLDAAGAARAVRPGLPGDPARPSEGDHPPRHQAVERAGHAATTASRCPR